MRLLFISDSLRRGGKERQLTELIQQLVLKGYEVSIIVFDPNIGYPEIKKLNVDIEILNKKGFGVVTSVFKMWQIVRKFKPDVIHSWSPLTTILISPSSMILSIPLIDSIRYAKRVRKFSKTWLFSKLSFSLSKQVIANSKAGLTTHDKTENAKYKVIYNGYNFDRNKTNGLQKNIRKELGINQKFVVGMVANFLPGKDYNTFITGAQQIHERHPDIAFVCVGEGPTRKLIENGINPKNRNRFYFTGRRNDVEEIVKLFDIGILLSNTNISAEGISNALVEIMSVGTPVIATNAGGNPELIENNREGYLINVFDQQSFVNYTELLKQDDNLRNQMGALAKEKIFNNFSIDIMVNKYINTYTLLAK